MKGIGVFPYARVLKKPSVVQAIPRPKKEKRLPSVLSAEEVQEVLESVENLKHRALLMLIYSAGLRVGEVICLKVEDINSDRMLIYCKTIKGEKRPMYATFREGFARPTGILERVSTTKMAFQRTKR